MQNSRVTSYIWRMTVLAQEWHALHQHSRLGTAMRIMAYRTALPDRLMFVKKRPAFLRVALITGFIDRVLYQITTGPSMRVVAIRADHLAFPDGMAIKTVHLCALVGMAGKTDFRLRSLYQHRVLGYVYRMTCSTRQISRLVLAAAPVHTNSGLMTAQTRLVLFSDVGYRIIL